MNSKHKRHVEVVDLDRPHVPLASFRVLYIGRAAPKATLDSLESIQKPLGELYTKDENQSRDTDVDAVLTVYTSGLQMEPVNQLDKDLWLPIQNLQSSAAVKAVVEDFKGCVDPSNVAFLPVDSAQASKSPYPPIFTCVMGRSNGLPLNDCYAFICQSNDASLLIVQATMHAFGNKSGWAIDRPPKRAITGLGRCSQDIVVDEMDDMPADFYERPPIHGFFYTPSPSLIQKYNIQGGGCSVDTRSRNGQLQSPYIPERPIVMKPPSPPPAKSSVNPMLFYGTDQSAIFIDEPFDQGIQTPAPPRSFVQFQDEPAQAVAFNPYLVPSLDPPGKTILKKTTVTDSFEIPAVMQEQVVFNSGQYGDDDVIYQKKLPRSNIGVDQAYANQGGNVEFEVVKAKSSGGSRRGGIQSGVAAGPQLAYIAVENPTEDLYANRLPPPAQQPLPQGARQFDSNFILQQSDTDKARMADVRNLQGYTVAPGLSAADFGF